MRSMDEGGGGGGERVVVGWRWERSTDPLSFISLQARRTLSGAVRQFVHGGWRQG